MTNNPNPSERIKLELPQSYKISHQSTDQGVWDELEKYLYQGFLTATSVLREKTFVFKTLNAQELRNIEFARPSRQSTIEARAHFRATFIAYSIFMVDGQNMLPDRHRHIVRLIRTISKFPGAEQDKILQNLSALNERAARVFPLTEVYVYENRSRYKWLHNSSDAIHSPMNTGIAGSDQIGSNHCQQMWTALNRAVDRKEDIERDWTNAKFIGSCFAGKGVRSIDEKDRGRKEKERVDREDLKMKLLYKYLNRNVDSEAEMPELHQLPDGRMAEITKRYRADSAEELRTQLESALNNEKDHHDRVIEKKQHELYLRARDIENDQRLIFTRQVDDVGNSTTSGARILGGKEVAEAYLARMKDLSRIQRERNRKKVEQEEQNPNRPPGENE